jgi:hypothetical protein
VCACRITAARLNLDPVLSCLDPAHRPGQMPTEHGGGDIIGGEPADERVMPEQGVLAAFDADVADMRAARQRTSERGGEVWGWRFDPRSRG